MLPRKGFATPQRVCVLCATDAPVEHQDHVGVLKNTRKSMKRATLPVLPSSNDFTTSVSDDSCSQTTLSNGLEGAKVDALQVQVTDLLSRVAALQNENSKLQHSLLEQEEVQAQTMLLLTETMTRVSHLELNQQQESVASETSSEAAGEKDDT